MLKFYKGELKEAEDDFLVINMFSDEDSVSPEYVMESIINSLLKIGVSLQDKRDLHKGVIVTFSTSIPEGHDKSNYLDVPTILSNMEHQVLVDFYNKYCGESCFREAHEHEGSICYSFMLTPILENIDSDSIRDYYQEYVV